VRGKERGRRKERKRKRKEKKKKNDGSVREHGRCYLNWLSIEQQRLRRAGCSAACWSHARETVAVRTVISRSFRADVDVGPSNSRGRSGFRFPEPASSATDNKCGLVDAGGFTALAVPARCELAESRHSSRSSCVRVSGRCSFISGCVE
jgi:hypothetical protein